MVTNAPHAPTQAHPAGSTPRTLDAIELFAGVGGFRVGLERAGWSVVWSNQWEPGSRTQHASSIYVKHFGIECHSNEDIHEVLDRVEAGAFRIPDHDLLVGGFPCQDYSVARTRAQAHGLRGKKGVLWWEIERAARIYRPRMLFLENVDRLLKSPTSPRQPGRDFAVMLASLADLGYAVEWRVVNAAHYGFPQKRRRVFIIAYREDQTPELAADPVMWLAERGPIARALPMRTMKPSASALLPLRIDGDLPAITDRFNMGGRTSPFLAAGIMVDRRVWTTAYEARHNGPSLCLGDVLEDAEAVPPSYWVNDEAQIERWRYLKGPKHAIRVSRATGMAYTYDEGGIPFPDAVDGPSRTIVTGEGGPTPSRFKHIIEQAGRYRRLVPTELERLNGFDPGWTDGIPDGRRAFLMGNALVVGIIERIGRELARL